VPSSGTVAPEDCLFCLSFSHCASSVGPVYFGSVFMLGGRQSDRLINTCCGLSHLLWGID